jgi:flagellin-like protein
MTDITTAGWGGRSARERLWPPGTGGPGAAGGPLATLLIIDAPVGCHVHTTRSGGGDDRGQSAVIGVALLIAIALLGTTAVLALGGAALTDTQTQSSLERAEHQMTLFDSRAAMVALSDSDIQTVELGQGSGSYRIEDGTGRITITHVGFTNDSSSYTLDGNIADDGPNDDDHQIFSSELGSVVYERGNTRIAYQGGGVWRVGSGDPRMVSPPEFHYRGATLTLPVINTTAGDGRSGAGTVSARVTPDEDDPFSRMYPDPNGENGNSPYPDGDGFRNPVEEGYIVVEVQSEYYAAWADYFRKRTTGDVTTWASNETARLELVTIGDLGSITFSSKADSILVRGKERGYSLNEFDLDLHPDGSNNDAFNSMKWSLHTENREGDRLEMSIERASGGGSARCNGGSPNPGATLTVYYYDDSADEHEMWTAPIEMTCADHDGDGQVDARLNLDLTNTSIMASPGSGGKVRYYGVEGSYRDPDFDDGIPGETDETYGTSDSESLYNVTNHYFALMGDEFTLEVHDQTGGDGALCYSNKDPNCEASGGRLDYDGNNRVVTYLHITENRIEVSLD